MTLNVVDTVWNISASAQFSITEYVPFSVSSRTFSAVQLRLEPRICVALDQNAGWSAWTCDP